jgi:cobalt/nickel transport system permease protein
MAVVAPLVGYAVYSMLAGSGKNRTRVLIGTFIAGWISTLVASFVCAVLLAASGIVSFRIAVTAMTGWHLLIGIGEGLITALVISYLTKVKPSMVKKYDPGINESAGVQ